jgi:Flp pilus assembly pilin Flp
MALQPRRGFLVDRLVRFVADDGGQDLIEYAFLAAFLATAGMLALNAILPAVGATYSSWVDPSTGVPSRWDSQDMLTSSGS